MYQWQQRSFTAPGTAGAGLVRAARILSCSNGREEKFHDGVIAAISRQADMNRGAVGSLPRPVGGSSAA